MNIYKVVIGGHKATTMACIAAIIAITLTACGGGSHPLQAGGVATVDMEYDKPFISPPMPVGVVVAVEGTVDSFWQDMAGAPLIPTESTLDVDVDGPLTGPGLFAGNFDAMAWVGSKCIAVFSTARGTGEGRFGTTMYVEKDGQVEGYFVDDQNVEEANEFISYYRPYCS